mmetsp:Transcript_16879/g.30664  ORF Transcript_16879/g.30664 Transcript_16879/m.30664 type:complete len:228 (-) Transcript_16879:448-1131(-)
MIWFENKFVVNLFIVAIIKEKLTLCINVMLGIKAYLYISIHSYHFWFNIWRGTVVGISSFVPLTRGIHHQVRAQVEQVAHIQFIINHPPPFGFFLRDDFTHILMNEISPLQCMLCEKTPTRLLDIRFGNEKVTMPPHANVIVATSLSLAGGGRLRGIGACATRSTEVGIALPIGGVARTGVGAALARALTSAEEVGAFGSPAAGFGAEEAVGDAAAVVVAGAVVIAG